MVISPGIVLQGDIWWADLADPPGSTAGYRRPVLIIQGDAINRSRIDTVICIPLTSNLKWAMAPGNVKFSATMTGLDRDSVAQVALIVTIDKCYLIECVGRIPSRALERVFNGLDVVLGR
jgi:mRNA interferase MazF